MRIYIINITLNYKHTLCTKVVYINCLINNVNIFINKTLVSSFNILFTHLFINKKPYYSSSLSLNKSINLTSIGL